MSCECERLESFPHVVESDKDEPLSLMSLTSVQSEEVSLVKDLRRILGMNLRGQVRLKRMVFTTVQGQSRSADIIACQH